MNGRIIAAWTLIVIGSIILLHQMDLVYLDRPNILSVIFLGIGLFLSIKGFNHPKKSGILSGSFFILFGLAVIMMRMNFIPLNDSIGFGIVFLSLGMANFIYFAFRPKKATNIIFGIIFLIIGAPFVLSYYYYIPYWEIEDFFRTYWPVLLILVGLGLLAEGIIKNIKKNSKDITKTA